LQIVPIVVLILSIVSGLLIIPKTYDPALAQQQEERNNEQSALSIVGSMRENGGNLTATNRLPLNANLTY
jgi:hypothetical protein